jgi:transposase-like protein
MRPCVMFMFSMSTTHVGEVVETLTDSKPSPSTVSRVFHTLEEEFQAWKTRSLSAHYLYAFADGTYFTVIYSDEGCKMPIIAVVGITDHGEREVLALGRTLGQPKATQSQNRRPMDHGWSSSHAQRHREPVLQGDAATLR